MKSNTGSGSKMARTTLERSVVARHDERNTRNVRRSTDGPEIDKKNSQVVANIRARALRKDHRHQGTYTEIDVYTSVGGVLTTTRQYCPNFRGTIKTNSEREG